MEEEGLCEGSVHTRVRGCCTHLTPFRGSVCACRYLCVLAEGGGVCVRYLRVCAVGWMSRPHTCVCWVSEHPPACAQWEK